VIRIVRGALAFMTPVERTKYLFLVGLRALVGLFDLVGILAIGFVATSIALFVINESESTRIIQLGSLTIPALTSQTLPFATLMILALFVAKALFSILMTRQVAFFLAKVEARGARLVAENAFGEGLEEARQQSREEIHHSVQEGSPALFNSALNALGNIIAEGILFILVIAGLIAVDPFFAVAIIVFFGLLALAIQMFVGSRVQKLSAKIVEGSIDGNQAISDLSNVLKEATVQGKKPFYFQKIYDARMNIASNLASQLTLGAVPRYIVETALLTAVALFVLFQSLSGDLVKAAGTVGIFLAGGLRLTASLLPLQSAFMAVKLAVPSAERALKFLDKKKSGPTSTCNAPEHESSAKPRQPPEVVLSRVSFQYPNSSVKALENVSLSIGAGQQAALIGESGAGKSTIADLILGLLSPGSGEVTVSGKSPGQIIEEVPGRLGYVPQRPGLVSGTIADNIALGVSRNSLDSERLKKAIQSAHLGHVLSSLPEGADSLIGKRMDALSGGQLQRIGLARALYASPSLLVMDEATSSLDAESENEINKALDRMRGSVTVVLIAHRLNTVQRSDIVFLVEAGRITASGKFSDLLRSNERVQNLARLMAIDPAG
jgi:ABC-type multidrug transport system fused ATPase/permease subunit